MSHDHGPPAPMAMSLRSGMPFPLQSSPTAMVVEPMAMDSASSVVLVDSEVAAWIKFVLPDKSQIELIGGRSARPQPDREASEGVAIDIPESPEPPIRCR